MTDAPASFPQHLRKRLGQWVFPVFSILFLVYLVMISQNLTFFWDDYETLLVISRDPVGQLLMSGAGHYGPLWRLLFTLQVFVFGSWFPGYILAAGLFGLAGVWLLIRSLEILRAVPRWLSTASAIVFFTALGPVAQILIAVGSEWTSAFFFGTLAFWLFVRGGSTWTWFAALVASALCLNGTFPVYVSLFLAVVTYVHRREQLDVSWWRTLQSVGLYWLWLPLAAAWTVASSVLGQINATPYYQLNESTSVIPAPVGVGEVLRDWIVLTGSWLSSPMLPGILTEPLGVTTFSIALADHFVLVMIVVLVTSLALLIAFRNRIASFASSESFLVLVVLAIPVLVWALVIAYGRADSIHIVRYATIWLPFAALFWGTAAAEAMRSGKLLVKGTGIAISVILVVSAAVGLARFPQTIESAANLDRDRLTWSVEQMRVWDECLVSDDVDPVEEVSPRLDSDAFCETRRFVEKYSLVDRWLK